MSAKIIDGKMIAAKIKENLKKEVQEMKNAGIIPGLAVILVGDNPASRLYVNNKKKACAEIGIESYEYHLPETVTEDELLALIQELNSNRNVNGILCQLPLPGHISEEKIINAIDPLKDADCFHPINVGRLMTGKPLYRPCTPYGVIEMIKEAGVNIEGKECVVIGRSNIVGKPLAIMLLAENGTVTVCHSKTEKLEAVCKRADILVAAIGKARFIGASHVKEGAVVIDVGINRDGNGKLCGDVDFDAVKDIAAAISPVPGGVGPMTIAMLMKNTVMAAKIQNS